MKKGISFQNIFITLYPALILLGSVIKIKSITLANIAVLYSLLYLIFSFSTKKIKGIEYEVTLWVVFLVQALLSLILSKYGFIGGRIFFSLFTGIVSMFFISSFNIEEIKYFLKGLKLLLYLIIFFSIIEIFRGQLFFATNEVFYMLKNKYGYYYPLTFFVNTNDLSQFLVIVTPVILVLNERKRMIYTFLIASSVIFILINSQSKLGFLCIGMTYILYFVLKNMKNKIYFVFAIVPLVLLSSIYSSSFIIEDFVKISTKELYFQGRAEIYLNLIKAWQSKPLFGVGLGGSYFSSEVGPHNLFLFLLTDFGILFLILFILSLIKLFIELGKNSKKNIKMNRILMSLILTFPLFSSISSGNEQRKIIWIFLGMAYCINKTFKRRNNVN